MKKEEILKVVRSNEGTVLSFPDRGPWGNNRYRGNCSGYIHAFLIDQYNVDFMAEMYAGGGTGYDICKDMQVKYVGADLNPIPVRPNICVCNALTDEIPEEFSEADFVFQHMPYPEIGIKYAGSEYTDPEGKLKTQDIGQMKFKEGMVANNKVTMKLYNSMHPGAKMGILCGNVRRKGKYHDMMLSLALPGEIIQNIVKMQHHCVSDGRTYVSTTWRDVFRYVLYNIGGKAHYKEIAEAVKGYKKSEKNNNVEAKARQTLRQYTKTFTPLGNGYYKLVA